MIKKERPAVIDAADKINDVVEDLALVAAGLVSDGDPGHVAGTTNEQVYIPATNQPAPSGDLGPAGMRPLETPRKEQAKKKKSEAGRVSPSSAKSKGGQGL